jgi:N-acetylglutamate synthase-like GNAT family acetyltransferase
MTHYKELKKPDTEEAWQIYHRIRQVEIFDVVNISYDIHHPSLSDKNHYHYLFIMGKKIIGVLHLQHLTESACAIRTIAIQEPFKNKGLGSDLIRLAEQTISRLGCQHIHLHANPLALSFYEKNGYKETPFPNDISIYPNCIDMGKRLTQ